MQAEWERKDNVPDNADPSQVHAGPRKRQRTSCRGASKSDATPEELQTEELKTEDRPKASTKFGKNVHEDARRVAEKKVARAKNCVPREVTKCRHDGRW
jgi:hypothetical protein